MHSGHIDSYATIKTLPSFHIPDAWIKIKRAKEFNRSSPTVLVCGSVLEFAGSARELPSHNELQEICAEIAAALCENGFNYLNGACPGLPDIVMKEFNQREHEGVSVGMSAYASPHDHFAYKPFAPEGFPLSADITVFCGTGFEFLNVLNTIYVDLLICVGGGLGTFLEACTAIEQEIPVFCYKPSGGVAREIESVLEKYIASFKSFSVKTVDDLEALRQEIALFAERFRLEKSHTRLTPLIDEIVDQASIDADPIKISVPLALDRIEYSANGRTIYLRDPCLLVDRVKLARLRNKGESMLHALDERSRVYEVDGVGVKLTQHQRLQMWGPSVDTVLLLQAVVNDCINDKQYVKMLDIGSGSGLVSLWLAAKSFTESVHAIDISAEAQSCFLSNAARLGLHKACKFEKASFSQFEATGKFDLIVCNPPYIPMRPGDTTFDSKFSGTELMKEVLDRFEKLLEKGGRLYLVVSSVAFADPEIASRIGRLLKAGNAEYVLQKDVPLKVGSLMENEEWTHFLHRQGGIELHPDEDYEFWHRVSILRIGPAADGY